MYFLQGNIQRLHDDHLYPESSDFGMAREGPEGVNTMLQPQ